MTGSRVCKIFLAALFVCAILCQASFAATAPARFPDVPSIPLPTISFGAAPADSPRDVALTLQVLALMTVLSLVPAILLMVTSFTRIIIVLGFVQRAIGLQQSPPQQVIAGLALFLTMFTMYPTWNRVYVNSLEPYMSGRINSQQAYDNAIQPVREIMFRYTRQ